MTDSGTLYLGTRKGLYTATKSDGHWAVRSLEFPGVQVPMLLPDRRDGTLYATLDHGHFGTKFHRRMAGAADWEELDAPVYPAKPDEVPDLLDPVRGTAIPWSLQKIWCLEPGGAGEPGLLYAGTLPGGLFRSRDRGESWELIRSLWDRPERGKWFGGGYDVPGIHSLCVDPRDCRHLLAAVSCGGVWRSRDGGNTWSQTAHGMTAAYMPPGAEDDPEIQDPHRMVQCPAAPDHLWAQHHNGIFHSTDGAVSWQEITTAVPSNFGFAVAVHPTEPGTAWFAPAVKDEMRIPVDGRLVVSRTRDGGKTFEVFGKGLPHDFAGHLVYRHCLEIDAGGTLLAMGSTTGGLWISSDAGESWETVTQDLPPIFCVRWGR